MPARAAAPLRAFGAYTARSGSDRGRWRSAGASLVRHLLQRARAPDPLPSLSAEQRAGLRLVIGLGNPGARYANTRHNVGFRCVEELATRYRARWIDDRRRTRCHLALASADDVLLVLAKPATFMNASGEAVVRLVQTLDVPTQRILVVYDDMDLPLGSLRLRERGGPGTHNGMRSVLALLGTEEIPRLRIGVGQAGGRDAREYVLSPFDDAERAAAEAAVARAADAAARWAARGAAAAMNQFNA